MTLDPIHERHQVPLFVTHLVVLIALMFCMGIGTAHIARFSYLSAFLPYLSAVFFFTAIYLWLKRKMQQVIFLVCAIFYLLGMIHTLQFLKSPDDPSHISTRIASPTQALLQGTVTQVPSRREYGTVLHMEASGMAVIDVDPSPLPPVVRPVYGKVRLVVYGPPADWITPGSHILVKALLRPPQPQRNPGGFDFKSHLHTQHIFTTGSVASFSLVQKVKPTPQRSFLKKTAVRLEMLRFYAVHTLDHVLQNRPAAVRGIYKAILMGERGEIPNDVLEAFKGAGTMHLLAISGLHMGVISAFFFFVCRFFFSLSSRFLLTFSLDRWSAICALLPLTVYAFFAGLQPPVVRALIMTALFFWAVVARRKHTLINLIAAAALIILAANPLLLFSPSFQLSFVAVTAIALVVQHDIFLQTQKTPNSTPWVSALQKTRCWLLASIVISVAATVATAPLLFFHFNRVSLLSPMSTLIMEPILCLWSLLSGIMGLILYPVFPQAGAFLLQAGSLGIELLLPIAHFFAAIPGGSLWWPTPSVAAVVAIYAVLLFIFLETERFCRRVKISAVVAVFLLLLPGIRLAKRILATTSTVTFLDVKHGSSAIIELPGNKTFLLDGGSMGGNSRPGQRIIGPALWSKGIFRLDGIVVTHGDNDHVSGLDFVAQRFRPQQIWTQQSERQGQAMKKLLISSSRLQIPVKHPASGTVLYEPAADTSRRMQDSIRLEVVAGAGRWKEVDMSTNDLSLVVRLTHGQKKILFPGDLEKTGEKRLLSKNNDLLCSVLLAPHHGSNSSNSLQFLKKTAPQWLVISAPGKNKHFPHPAVIKRAKSLGITMINTGDSGAITCVTDGRTLQVFSFLTPR